MAANPLTLFGGINELGFIGALIGFPVALFLFFWIRNDRRESRKQKAELLRLWQQGRPLHTVTAWQIMPLKTKKRFQPPPSRQLISMIVLGLLPLALAQQWLGILWLAYAATILSPALYVIPWFRSRNPDLLYEPSNWESVDGEKERITHGRMQITELPWWVHHAWRNYQFTQFWLILGLYGSFFVGMGLLGLSLFKVLSRESGLRETLPFMGIACLIALGLTALVLVVLMPLRLFSRWQLKRWDAQHAPTDQESIPSWLSHATQSRVRQGAEAQPLPDGRGSDSENDSCSPRHAIPSI